MHERQNITGHGPIRARWLPNKLARLALAALTAAAGVGFTGTANAALSNNEAARFLIQSTWGPDSASIKDLAESGYTRWLNRQFETPRMDTHFGYVTRKGPIGCENDAVGCNSEFINAAMESFWHQAVEGPDQLRQRVTWALSQIFVVSAVNSPLDGNQYALASYYDTLATHAFGNFRDLLEAVSLHPSMGHYLTYLRNEREDPSIDRLPDENYAREVMQLFTIGLWMLNPDGSRQKDENGKDIPSYTQRNIMGLAKVFTGFSWGGGARTYDRWMGWGEGTRLWDQPMQCYDSGDLRFHSRNEKRIVGRVIPQGTRCDESFRIGILTLFNHPNVGPFIGSQLIKRLVTSNPTKGYVERVTNVFNDNGQGVRGDMKAVIRAILMDPEARKSENLGDPRWGKLREPVLRFSAWLRAFGARSSNGRYCIWNLEDTVSSLGQNPYRAPSVFNWYRPDYSPPGEMRTARLLGPEFQITHEVTATGYTNFISSVVERGYGWNENNIRATYRTELSLAHDPAALVRRLDLLLTAGQLRSGTRTLIEEALASMPIATDTDRQRRVWAAVTLVMASPDFVVQK